MRAGTTARPETETRTGRRRTLDPLVVLLPLAALVLFVFYYWARADAVV